MWYIESIEIVKGLGANKFTRNVSILKLGVGMGCAGLRFHFVWLGKALLKAFYMTIIWLQYGLISSNSNFI